MPGLEPTADRDLIAAVIAGDEAAFQRFLDQFAARFLTILRGGFRFDPDTAEDLLQEFFIHLLERDARRLSAWSGRGPLRAYLSTLLRRFACDQLEQRSQFASEDGAQDPDEAPHEGPSPDDLVHVGEVEARLRQCMEALAGPQRRALELRYFGDASYAEIAAEMDLTVNHVGVLLHRAEKALRAALEAQYPDLAEELLR